MSFKVYLPSFSTVVEYRTELVSTLNGVIWKSMHLPTETTAAHCEGRPGKGGGGTHHDRGAGVMAGHELDALFLIQFFHGEVVRIECTA